MCKYNTSTIRMNQSTIREQRRTFDNNQHDQETQHTNIQTSKQDLVETKKTIEYDMSSRKQARTISSGGEGGSPKAVQMKGRGEHLINRGSAP